MKENCWGVITPNGTYFRVYNTEAEATGEARHKAQQNTDMVVLVVELRHSYQLRTTVEMVYERY